MSEQSRKDRQDMSGVMMACLKWKQTYLMGRGYRTYGGRSTRRMKPMISPISSMNSKLFWPGMAAHLRLWREVFTQEFQRSARGIHPREDPKLPSLPDMSKYAW